MAPAARAKCLGDAPLTDRWVAPPSGQRQFLPSNLNSHFAWRCTWGGTQHQDYDMRTMTIATAVDWIHDWVLKDALFGKSYSAETPAPRRREFHVSERVPPVHAILAGWTEWLVAQGNEILIVVDEHGVWPSSEDWNLYYRWRQAAGDHERIEQSPGHLFACNESNDATSLMVMARLFGWGIYAVARESRRAVLVDHDGHGVVVAADSSVLASAPM